MTSPKQKGYGKWYPRAVMTNTVDTDALATIMQRNCTVKKSDILAVISELIETMQDQLQDSKRVKLNGFGTFKIGMRLRFVQDRHVEHWCREGIRLRRP